MKIPKITVITLIIVTQVIFKIHAKETECVINGKKIINIVNGRFLSFSVDPAMLAAASNSSFMESMEQLVRYLSPAFLRVAGPSTEFLEVFHSEMPADSNSSKLLVTPTQWTNLNRWIKKMDLIPIYAINDKSKMWWKSTLESFLGDVNDQMDFSCYWQLGYDCKAKSVGEYQEDLEELKRFLDSHRTSRRDIFKIVGANLQSCLSNKSPELIRKVFRDLEHTVDAVVWEKQNVNKDDLIYFSKSYIPIWLTLPKGNDSPMFSSALIWAKQLGQAAKNGYEVIFRQPRFYELFTDTPAFWISLVHKNLMGENVLEVRTNDLPNTETNIYSHCTKSQGNYFRQGSITIMVVNTGNYGHTTSLRVASSKSRLLEVQSYILTADKDNSTTVYLNNRKLNFESLKSDRMILVPKMQMIWADNVLGLKVPPKSVGFFVLPGAGISVCNQDDREDKTVEEKEHEGPSSFQELLKNIQTELETDRNYYKKLNPTNVIKTRRVPSFPVSRPQAELKDNQNFLDKINKYRMTNKKTLEEKRSNQVLKLPKQQPKVIEKRNFPKHLWKSENPSAASTIFARPSLKRHKKPTKELPKLEIVFTERPASSTPERRGQKKIELELTQEEIRKILVDRAKSRVSGRNLDITIGEIDETLTVAAKRFLKKELGTRHKRNRVPSFKKPSLKERLSKKYGDDNKRTKRDINMKLLRMKTNQEKPRNNYNVKFRPWLRKPEWSPEEELLMENEFAEGGRISDPTEIYAELEDQNFQNDPLRDGEKYVDERITFLSGSEGVDSGPVEDFGNYHTFQETFLDERDANKRNINRRQWMGQNFAKKTIQNRANIPENARFLYERRYKRDLLNHTAISRTNRRKNPRKPQKVRKTSRKPHLNEITNPLVASENPKSNSRKKEKQIKILEKRLEKLKKIDAHHTKEREKRAINPEKNAVNVLRRSHATKITPEITENSQFEKGTKKIHAGTEDDSFLNEIRKSGEIYKDHDDLYVIKSQKRDKVKRKENTNETRNKNSTTELTNDIVSSRSSGGSTEVSTTEVIIETTTTQPPELITITTTTNKTTNLAQQKLVDIIVNATNAIFEGIFAKIAFYMS